MQKRFCSNCGQENTETRQSFRHLLGHFIEDLTHYDTSFWLTMRYLIFRPAYLTKEFLKGRRSSFVPPVRLYIFISFVTFLLPYILVDISSSTPPESARKIIKEDTLKQKGQNLFLKMDEDGLSIVLSSPYKSLRELDSVQSHASEKERLDVIDRWVAKKAIRLQKYNRFELAERFLDVFEHSFPKALFLYLPLFAFTLWLFHGKKRWIYFDHAIFTLHYFSFLLLAFNLLSISSDFFFLSKGALILVKGCLTLALVLAVLIYFYVAHKRMYGEHWLISLLKASFIYLINLSLLICVFVCLVIISLSAIH